MNIRLSYFLLFFTYPTHESWSRLSQGFLYITEIFKDVKDVQDCDLKVVTGSLYLGLDLFTRNGMHT